MAANVVHVPLEVVESASNIGLVTTAVLGLATLYFLRDEARTKVNDLFSKVCLDTKLFEGLGPTG